MEDKWSVELTDDEWGLVYKALIHSNDTTLPNLHAKDIAQKVHFKRMAIAELSPSKPIQPTHVTTQEKPPLGIMPARLFYEERTNQIIEAMNRYIQVNKPIPNEWVKEYNAIVSQWQT
ncbi:MAG: hypothetical protein M0R51_11900 [Clostridia bacterium]|jgi:hypothetical protein|nr:hypothetical protein [Clostridia bacterium]